MHCILCFMWVRVLSSLLHVIHICRGANLPSSSSWMYIAYISLLLFYFSPICWWLTKRGEWFWVYICIFRNWVFAYNKFMHVLYFMCIHKGKGGEGFWKLNKKGEKVFGRRMFGLCMFLSPCLCIYICLVLCTSLIIYLFIVMHELRGSFYEAYL